MNINYNRWRSLFLFCLGLGIASAFCMKWMEDDLVAGGRSFTILGLELYYPADKIKTILGTMDDHVKTILRYHLSFDFAFMAGVYPGIAALCMMARERTANPGWKKWLYVLAALQLTAWGCDIAENIRLFKWMSDPSYIGGFGFYHAVVYTKWILALTGVLIALPFFLRRRVNHALL